RAIDAELRTRLSTELPAAAPPPARPNPNGIIVAHGDAADLRDHLADGSIDLIVTSPPHNLGQAYADGVEDDLPYEEFLGRDGRAARWARELYRIAAPAGRLCLHAPLQVWIGGSSRFVAADWRDRLVEAGWPFRSLILWAKSRA